MHSFVLIGWLRGFIEGGGWIFLWLGFFGALFNAVREHKKLWGEVKRTEGKEERSAILKMVFDWMMVLITLAGAISSQLSSETADKKINDQGAAISNATARVHELEARAEDRTITDAQSNLFMLLIADCPKIPVRVFVGLEDVETVRYAKKIRALLDTSGFGAKDGEGVKRLGGGFVDFSGPRSAKAYGVFIHAYGTNGNNPALDRDFINSANFPRGNLVLNSTNSITTSMFLGYCLDRIGLNTSLGEDAYYLKPGEIGIWVPQKNH